MRTGHKMVMSIAGFAVWMLVMYFGPTMPTDQSAFLYPGLFLFGIVLVFWLGVEVTNRYAYQWSMPGHKGTINPADPFATVSLAGLREDDALTYLECYALGGNHKVLTEGGGPDNGYVVCPSDLVEKWKGDPAQVWFNCDLQPHRLKPRKGELPLTKLDKEVRLAVMKHKKWTNKCVVWYGIYSHQEGMRNKPRERHLEERVRYLNETVESLEAENKGLRNRLSAYREMDPGYRPPKKGFLGGEEHERR